MELTDAVLVVNCFVFFFFLAAAADYEFMKSAGATMVVVVVAVYQNTYQPPNFPLSAIALRLVAIFNDGEITQLWHYAHRVAIPIDLVSVHASPKGKGGHWRKQHPQRTAAPISPRGKLMTD